MLLFARPPLGYFVVVFVAGFVLGILRVLVVAPYLGEPGAVLIELPVMLAISWVTCGLMVNRFSVPDAFAPRLIMGGGAFVLLMGAELALSVFAFNRSITQHFAALREAPAIAGLVAQIAFALFPLLRRHRSDKPGSWRIL